MSIRVAPFTAQILAGPILLVIAWVAVNLMVQLARKPTEVFVAVGGSLAKVPAQPWQDPLFNEHGSHHTRTARALAQVESNGNPVARTYWRVAVHV